MWRSLHQDRTTFAILGIPVEDLVVEPTTQEVLTIMGKLNVPHSFRVPNVSMSVSLVFYDIEKMHLALKSTQQKEMSYFRKKSNNLKAFLIAPDPTEHLLLRQETVLPPALVVDRRLYIA